MTSTFRLERDFLGEKQIPSRRVRESVTLVTALNPIIGYEKAAMIAKTAIATGTPIDEVAQAMGIMTRAEVDALLVPEKLTQPLRARGMKPGAGTKSAFRAVAKLFWCARGYSREPEPLEFRCSSIYKLPHRRSP